MTEYRAITYRLIPGTREKAATLSQIAGACRYVWNFMLERQKKLHEADEDSPYPNHVELSNAFKRLRDETPWLKELPCVPIRYTMKYQADAWAAFFRGNGGHPKFKGRHGDDSFTIPQEVRIRDGKLHVPKTGWYVIRRKGPNPYEGCEPVKAVIKRSVGKWYATVVYKVEAPETADNGLAVGVDMNVGQVAVSTGDVLHAPDTERLEAKAKRHRRTVERRKPGSSRRAVARERFAKSMRKLARVRRNWQHHISRTLADTAGMVVVENLKPQALTCKGKGKRGLNRGIRETAWYQLRQMIGYKSAEMVKVKPNHTSQTCHECKTVDRASRKSQAEFHCAHCGHRANADVNAALNVLALGTEATGRRGAFALATPMNRQRMLARPALSLSVGSTTL